MREIGETGVARFGGINYVGLGADDGHPTLNTTYHTHPQPHRGHVRPSGTTRN
jgi:hypothetical protein